MKHDRGVWAEIDLRAIANNITEFQNIIKPDCQLMVVVKADAYGHGAVPVAEEALKNGANRLGVATVQEGRELRLAGISAPIQILSQAPVFASKEIVENDLIPTVCIPEEVSSLASEAEKAKKKVKVHVKVDTGMNRIGLFPDQVLPFLKHFEEFPSLEIEGISTHFALANQPQDDSTKNQFAKFTDLVDQLEQEGINIALKHAANSAACIFFPDTHLDMVRIGISLYGLHPSSESKGKISLEPALSLKAKVVYLKTIEKGEGVSYGLTYKAPSAVQVATLPLGYADGYTRLLSNKSEVLVEGSRASAIGNICMDQFMVNVTDISGVDVGTDVILIGRQNGGEISVDELAEILGTINYEITCMISKRVPRIYLDKGV